LATAAGTTVSFAAGVEEVELVVGTTRGVVLDVVGGGGGGGGGVDVEVEVVWTVDEVDEVVGASMGSTKRVCLITTTVGADVEPLAVSVTVT
jgi:hypothetical protein